MKELEAKSSFKGPEGSVTAIASTSCSGARRWAPPPECGKNAAYG